jgi:hypothetical protein
LSWERVGDAQQSRPLREIGFAKTSVVAARVEPFVVRRGQASEVAEAAYATQNLLGMGRMLSDDVEFGVCQFSRLIEDQA